MYSFETNWKFFKNWFSTISSLRSTVLKHSCIHVVPLPNNHQTFFTTCPTNKLKIFISSCTIFPKSVMSHSPHHAPFAIIIKMNCLLFRKGPLRLCFMVFSIPEMSSSAFSNLFFKTQKSQVTSSRTILTLRIM